MKSQADRKKARRRALRAAQVVTISLALAGCGQSHESTTDAGSDTSMMDAVVADTGRDTGSDTGSDTSIDTSIDTSMIDAVVADTGSDTSLTCDAVFPPNTRECCEAEPGGYWDEASGECWVAVPGPFVPPVMRA